MLLIKSQSIGASPMLPAAAAASCWTNGQLALRSVVTEVAVLHPWKLLAYVEALQGCGCG